MNMVLKFVLMIKEKIYVNNKNMGSSSIKVTKSNATVYAPKKTVKRKANSYFYIKVSDFTGALVKNTSIKVNVFTGKKVKTYSVKTNTKGVAKISTRKLLRFHKNLSFLAKKGQVIILF